MKADALAIVQFIHPGKEQTKVKDGQCEWNAATRSDKAWPHRRKFMLNHADYDHLGRTMSGVVGFWGEWEGPSLAQVALGTRIDDSPQFCHTPAYYEPASYAGLLDTDPFVFGDRFLYNGCQQHTSHNHPDGARDTFLRTLAVGSMVLFGSSMNQQFVLDTVLVVGDYTDYPNGDFAGLEGLVPEEYYHLTLHPQADGNPTVDSFRLYRGATKKEPVGGMFSFTPCRSLRSSCVGFARPVIDLPCITQSMTQGKKMTPAESTAAVRKVWDAVREQVAAQGCSVAHHIALRPQRVNHPLAKGYVAPKVVAPRHTGKTAKREDYVVETVRSAYIGEYLAIRAPGKKKAYTQTLPECKNVELREDDVVADVGSFIGEYAMRAAVAHVKEVRAYEPTPLSFDVLKQNLAKYINATAVNAAVVSTAVASVDLYISRGNGTRNRIDVVKGRDCVTVPAVNYVDAIAGATVIKMDTEGAEWTFPIAEHLSAPLRAIIIEFHPREDSHREQTKVLIGQIEAAGFEMVYPKSLDAFWERFDKHGKTWAAHGAWVRKGEYV